MIMAFENIMNSIELKQNSESTRAYCTSVNPLFWYSKNKEKESKFISDMWIEI